METPAVEQYVNITTHLRYLNEKCIEAFTLFIKLATAIAGGVFYTHLTLGLDDPRRMGMAKLADAVLCMAALAVIVMIVTNLSSWGSYRKVLSDDYPKIKERSCVRWWLSEAFMIILIVAFCLLFALWNPL